ncbi:thiamine-phosphate kinase [Methanosphaera sp. WGK6]|uniref:thiamine-phosphate kinase n=1 Tax=Methanosphaera sp. WGK6 TaxID=1561964 RepID=UPI0009FDC662|nr:thiamine-phosphate kinase [Methanosphaera sp. WGK6]
MIISELGEKKLIKKLLKKRDETLTNLPKTILNSYHDDAALQENKDQYTVISTDMLIQHTHFPKQMTPYQMGEKIVTVNVSDILAMNAKPESILISMALPKTLDVHDFDEIIDGILKKCEEYKITLIGGDLNQHDEIILCGTATGQINKEVKLQRNIEPTNLIAVTGQLGGPAAALDLINNDMTLPLQDKEIILNSLLEPNLPLKTSEILRKHPEIVTSITDITDGLAVELGHLHEKNNNLGFCIHKNKIPYNKYLEEIANANNKNLNEYLFHFGEEFELLLTLKKDKYNKYKHELKDIHVIGEVNNSNQITILENNSIKNMKIKGYEHLKEN